MLLGLIRRNRKFKKREKEEKPKEFPALLGRSVIWPLTAHKFLPGASYFAKVMWPFRNISVTMATSSQILSPWQFIRIFFTL